jgi:hypothetical protein
MDGVGYGATRDGMAHLNTPPSIYTTNHIDIYGYGQDIAMIGTSAIPEKHAHPIHSTPKGGCERIIFSALPSSPAYSTCPMGTSPRTNSLSMQQRTLLN